MRNHQVRWCTLNKFEIRVRCEHATVCYCTLSYGKGVSKFGTHLYVRHTLDVRYMYVMHTLTYVT